MDILHKVAKHIIKLFYNICPFFLPPIFLFSLISSNVASLTLCTLCRAVFLPAGMTGKTLAFMHEVGIWDQAAPRWAVEPKRKAQRRPQSDRDTKKTGFLANSTASDTKHREESSATTRMFFWSLDWLLQHYSSISSWDSSAFCHRLLKVTGLNYNICLFFFKLKKENNKKISHIFTRSIIILIPVFREHAVFYYGNWTFFWQIVTAVYCAGLSTSSCAEDWSRPHLAR